MPTDGGNRRFALESVQRVEALRQAERTTTAKQFGEKNGRRKRQTPHASAPADAPHDIVEISQPPPGGHEESGAPIPQAENSKHPDLERHLDIQA